MNLLQSPLLLLIAAPVVAMSLGTTRGIQQERPNFSGVWVLDSGQMAPGDFLGRGGTITQTDSTITFKPAQSPRNDTARVFTVRLDGSEFRHSRVNVRGEPFTHTTQGRWLTSALLITLKTGSSPSSYFESGLFLSLDGRGKLNVASVEPLLSLDPVSATRIYTYHRGP